MALLLLVAHAPLASSLLAVASHVYPDCGRTLTSVDVQAGTSFEDVQTQIREALDKLAAPEVLIMVDVFGATPCNAALAVADGVRTRVVAGVNVPMLWRTLCYAEAPLDDLVDRAVAGATQGVMQVSLPRLQNQPGQNATNDQVKSHDQQ